MNFLKKKVQKAFQSLTSEDGSDDYPNAGSFDSSLPGAALEVI